MFFQQTSGTPMGSPISPVFAELYMQYFESQVVQDHPKIDLYRRFVDDSFCIMNYDATLDLQKEFNQFNKHIQFTYEEEENGQISFLDVTLIRDEENQLRRKVFRKATHTGRYLNYSSYHHPSHKISVIDALLYRAFIISDPEYLEEEIQHVRTHLLSNNFPNTLIQSRIQRMRSRRGDANEDDKPRIILPYMSPVTHHLTNFLRRKLNCDFGYIPGRKIGNKICSHKQKEVPPKIGIYKISCDCGSSYIGETSRPMEERIKEHERDLTKKNTKSAIATHIIENNNHRIQTESATLIHREERYFHRKFKEGLLIRNTINKINRDLGMEINPIWTSLLLSLAPTLIRPTTSPVTQRPH
ncbi:hypothetical protein Fcan01_16401 [Folsomia candida]|uniref:GIY-YIG domain-containing protein n=1 Tax=Folsomia candida TaxID=158441 RepID=A0A226DV10_FOLCA|nr:hypothetical protein Fcan01_16401 [Folsomia candida]